MFAFRDNENVCTVCVPIYEEIETPCGNVCPHKISDKTYTTAGECLSSDINGLSPAIRSQICHKMKIHNVQFLLKVKHVLPAALPYEGMYY